MILEVRMQAELLYALRALMQHTTLYRLRSEGVCCAMSMVQETHGVSLSG